MVAEARSAEEPVLTRRCVIMKVPDFTTEKYLEARRQNAAAILILLPRNISSIPHDIVQVRRSSENILCAAGQAVKAGSYSVFFWAISFLFPQSFMVSESETLLKETLTPVYVVPEDEQLLYMYEEVKQAAASRTSSIFIRGTRSERIDRNMTGHIIALIAIIK